MSRPTHNRRGKDNGREDLAIQPAYLTWQGLSAYSSCSKRWLQSYVPTSLRFRINGKVLVRASDFDAWMERHRQGQDLDRVMAEVLGEREPLKSRSR